MLRRLIEQSQRSGAPKQQTRLATEAGRRFMLVMMGGHAGHHDVSRALYRGERDQFTALTEH